MQDKNAIKELLDFSCTRIELGVQCLDDKIYKFVNRGHTIQEVILQAQQVSTPDKEP